jgi:hypothetical protein
VILNVSEAAGNVMLDSLARMMDGGSLELLDANGKALAEMQLSTPAAKPAFGGELELNKIAEGTAAHAGNAEFARIVEADGITPILSCDVGDEKSNAVIKLSGTQINRGAPVRINSFRLAMP